MKTQTLYNIEINYKIGDRKINDFITGADLGIDGAFLSDGIKFTTTTKPTKKMKEKYENAIKKACNMVGKEVVDIVIKVIL